MVNQISIAPREDSLQFDAAQARVPVLQVEDLIIAELAVVDAAWTRSTGILPVPLCRQSRSWGGGSGWRYFPSR